MRNAVIAGVFLAGCAVGAIIPGATAARAQPLRPIVTVWQAAAIEIPCPRGSVVIRGESFNEYPNTYGLVAVEGCGQRLTYMVRGDQQSLFLVSRLALNAQAPAASP